ncbi:ABC transporter permease [Tatumella sp. JGM100]|mgnify:CR=1 FL=1|uniref:ABC transporter permease n=2 Tax=Tatumella TaxID=82986 RepID=A0ABW1VPV3_9GAMM|nr:ABC transporter permease [Tatumella sp. JGM16]MBS0877771.1 ABC transporter permease [Tatumella sp. JGM82]MBS0891440.1 ABC transporter permease [Tatumella sp. JGM94]MBS0894431.1 ABC transporter permease [Tatumella sp. JGM130]MBS0902406.1 ABC transporter permease [Tatumella sp. JGM100]MBS0913281.1 ABC transporter permease [Tatumella sp. JGM91]
MSMTSLLSVSAHSPRRRPDLKPGLLLATTVIVLAILAALFPQWFTRYNPYDGIAGIQLTPPDSHHWLGTDQLGRDLLSRIIYGTRWSLSAATAAVAVGLVAGGAVGMLAGFSRLRIDNLVMRLVDVLLSIPALLLSLSIIILLGAGTLHAALAVGCASVANFARLSRTEVLRIRHQDYIEAAFGSGGHFLSVFLRHVLPNALPTLLAFSALQFGQAILALSTLSFLGFGSPPPVPEWGLLIAEGRNYLATAWWLAAFPGGVVIVVVLAANRISRYFSGEVS